MKSVDRLLKLANKFEKKMLTKKFAQGIPLNAPDQVGSEANMLFNKLVMKANVRGLLEKVFNDYVDTLYNADKWYPSSINVGWQVMMGASEDGTPDLNSISLQKIQSTGMKEVQDFTKKVLADNAEKIKKAVAAAVSPQAGALKNASKTVTIGRNEEIQPFYAAHSQNLEMNF